MFDIENIKDPSFLQDLSNDELKILSKEIREFMVDKVSKTGGHLSGSLGATDIIIAMHKFFNHGEKFIFDVGHQTYAHKILTGRSKDFDKLRQRGGITGFPLREESEYDSWDVAHASTSLAALSGYILSGKKAVALIGDGALTGGEAIEALEYLSTLNKNAIIIINDNSFSISKNVGMITKLLDKMRSTKGYIKLSDKNRSNYRLKNLKNKIKSIFYKPNIFDDAGFKYYGPINGHNFNELFKYFKYAASQNRPVIIHCITKKGHGYEYAENDTIGAWHCVPKFNKETGEFIGDNSGMIAFSGALSEYLMKYYDKHSDLKVIMPAMTYPSNMVKLREHMGESFIDTGITEPFAASFAASLAINGVKVCLPIYSSFMQRAYDQLHQDIAMQNAPVVIISDKAGLVPGNGKTHQGIFDISYLNTIPNMAIVAPKDMKELYSLMDYSFSYNKPIAVHIPIPKTEYVDGLEIENSDLSISWTMVNNLSDPKAYIITYSSNVDYISESAKSSNIEVVNARFIKPMDETTLEKVLKSNKKVYIYEDAPAETSFGSMVVLYAHEHKIEADIKLLGFPLDFLDLGSIEELKKAYNLDKESIISLINKENETR